MGEILPLERSVTLAGQNFTILQQAKCVNFSGTWRLIDIDRTPRNEGDAGFDHIVNLDGTNYVVHPDDIKSFTDVIDDLKPGNNIHFRIRLLSSNGRIMQLDASGRIDTGSNAKKDLLESERRYAFLLTLSDSILFSNDGGDIQQTVCRLLAEHLIASRVYYVEYVDAEGAAVISHDYVRGEEVSRRGKFRIADLEPLTSLFSRKKTSVINDTFSASEIPGDAGSQYSLRGIRAQVAVPLFENERIAASLVVSNSTARQWTSFEISLIEETALRLRNAIQRAHTTATLRSAVKSYRQELQKNSEVLTQSEEVAGFGSWDFHFDSGKFEWSEGMYKLFQIPAGSHVEPEIYAKYVIEDDKEIADRIVNHFRKDLQPFEETMRLNVDSKVKTIKVKGRVLYENQKPSRFVGVDFDISALAESRKALEEQNERLLETQKIGQLGSYELDFVSNRVHWSEEMFRIMGFTPREGLSFEEALSVYTPEYSRRLRDAVEGAIATGENFELEATLERHNDKSIRHVFIAGRVVKDRFRAPTKLRGIAQDITDRKNSSMEIVRMKEMLAQRAENKYQQLFNSIGEGFCIIELIFDDQSNPVDYRFLETNPAFEQQTGLTNINGLTGKSVDLGHDPEWMNMYAHVAKTHMAIKSEKLAVASNKWYELYAFPADGFTSHRVAVLFHDITARKMSEREMKRMYGELKDLDSDKTNFFNNITHEFRTPLTLLLGPLEDVIKKSGPDLPNRQRDQLLLAQRHALRLQKLVNTLLDFARIEAGQAEPVFTPTDINAFTRDLAASFRSAIEAAGLMYVVDCQSIKEPVYLNRAMYEKIVLNLLSNALKFTFDGKIELQVRELDKTVELRVADTGVGISPADRKRIFQRFNRVESARSRTYEGTGIGLALVKEMVNMHGGTIQVKSDLHQGSEFIVRFPKGTHHLSPGSISETNIDVMSSSLPEYLEEVKSWLYEPETAVSENDRESSVKPIVLVVDDNHDMRTYLGSLLEYRYKVVKAENGQKAMEILELGLMPDLVLADVMMPQMNGYELLSAIKEKKWPKEIPVVLLTAQASEEAKIQGLLHGADDYLVKPFSSRELLARVESRIQIARLRAEREELLAHANKELQKLIAKATEELQNNNETLQRKNIELQSINQELEGLTFAAGHDMREPLRKSRFFLHRLMKDEEANLSPKGKEHFRKVMSFAQTMSDLVSDLSLYSFYSNNPPHKTLVNLDVVLFGLREFLRSILEEKKSTLNFNVSPVLTADPDQIKQLVYNLISNALKFRKSDSPLEIIVTGKMIPGKFIEHELAEKEKQYYELEVHDNGIGFEQQYEKQIFQVFRKLHGRAFSPGTGIGLTIVRKIMENHGGFVVAKSSLGLGASFKCYFPMEPIL